MYVDTITMFCPYTADGTTYWRATPLLGVDLNADRAAIIARYGESSADRAKLHVKFVQNAKGIYLGNEVYAVKPSEYDGTKGTVTFASGEDFSFFMDGLWNGAEIINDEDYAQGFYNYMNETNAEVYAVSSVAKYSVIPHFEVMAK